MNKEETLEIEDSRLELENRIRNLLWTVSGDYKLDMKPDVSLFLRSKAIALYDGIKQGALARFYDKDLLGLYLVKKVFLQADEGELTAVAQLCIEEAIGEKICEERPGIRNMQREAFEDILDQEFEKMPSQADFLGRLKVAVLRRRLDGGVYRVEQKLQPFMDLVIRSGEAEDTMELIRCIDELYNSMIDPAFEQRRGSLERVMAVTLEELTEFSWEDFLSEEMYEEALESVEDVRRSLLIALIDRKITKYFSNFDGLVKKLEKDKYFLIMRQSSLEALKEQRFHILDEVKTVNIGNEMAITLSIGVGLNASTYIQNYEYSRIAIEMALGRGGDQVVIKNGNNITYYGGKTQQMEKNTRVKARVKAQALKEFMSTKDRVVVMGHKITDVDALGAAIGIFRAGKTLGKSVSIVVNDPTKSIRPLIAGYVNNPDYEPSMFVDSEQAKDMVDNNTVVVVVDTNRPSYTECEELLHMTKTIVVLDHHRRGSEVIENAVLSYVEPYASSACEMVAEILQYFSDDLRIRNMEADCLYAGIMIDTNNFTTRAGVRTFEAAAFLRRSGADVTRVRKLLRDDLKSYQARAEAVRTAQIYRECYAIARCPSENLDSPTVIGAQAANELLNIAGVKASFVLTQYNNEVYISARAIDEVNVQVMMEKMGGGGHMNIAGAQVKASPDEVERMLKDIIDQEYQEENTK